MKNEVKQNLETEVKSENPEKSENILGTQKIGKLLTKFAIPGIISMVVNSLYNIVDQIFIGQGVGYLGNAATSVIFPLTTFATAFALLFGDGAASYMSLQLGKKNKEDASRGTAAGILGFVGIGIIIAVIYLIFLKPLCRIFGGTEAVLPYALEYGGIISLGLPFAAICAGGSSIIRADGNPGFNMIGLFTGTIINIVCDPLFIFVFHWGVEGAAWATILGQAANAFLNIYYFAKKMRCVDLNKEVWKNCRPYITKVSKLGISSFVTQMSMVLAIAIRNNVLVRYGAQSKYGSDIPLATLGITMKTFAIIMSIVIGLGAGAQPILGYNYGSENYARVKKTFKIVSIISTIICTVAFLIAQIFPMSIIKIFGSESDLYNEFAVKCMRIYLGLIPLAGIQIFSGIFFQALGYPVQSSVLSLSKQIIFQIPFTLILPIFLGIEGVLWTGPVSDLLSFMLTVILLLVYWKKIFDEKK